MKPWVLVYCNSLPDSSLPEDEGTLATLRGLRGMGLNVVVYADGPNKTQLVDYCGENGAIHFVEGPRSKRVESLRTVATNVQAAMEEKGKANQSFAQPHGSIEKPVSCPFAGVIVTDPLTCLERLDALDGAFEQGAPAPIASFSAHTLSSEVKTHEPIDPNEDISKRWLTQELPGSVEVSLESTDENKAAKRKGEGNRVRRIDPNQPAEWYVITPSSALPDEPAQRDRKARDEQLWKILNRYGAAIVPYKTVRDVWAQQMADLALTSGIKRKFLRNVEGFTGPLENLVDGSGKPTPAGKEALVTALPLYSAPIPAADAPVGALKPLGLVLGAVIARSGVTEPGLNLPTTPDFGIGIKTGVGR